MIILWAILTLLGISFLLIVLRGAPFVPTLNKDIETIFRIYRFKPHDVLVDLGSGDGRVLAAAARHNVKAVGYELNPFLAWYSNIKLRQVTPRPKVVLGDFWTNKLPDNTTVVFVFLAKPFMRRLDTKLEQEALRLGHDITLVSYGMEIPSKIPGSAHGAMVVYRYTA